MDLQTRFSEHDWSYIVNSREEDALPELDLDGLLAEVEEEDELLELDLALEGDGPAPPAPPLRRPTGREAEREAYAMPYA